MLDFHMHCTTRLRYCKCRCWMLHWCECASIYECCALEWAVYVLLLRAKTASAQDIGKSLAPVRLLLPGLPSVHPSWYLFYIILAQHTFFTHQPKRRAVRAFEPKHILNNLMILQLINSITLFISAAWTRAHARMGQSSYSKNIFDDTLCVWIRSPHISVRFAVLTSETSTSTCILHIRCKHLGCWAAQRSILAVILLDSIQPPA